MPAFTTALSHELPFSDNNLTIRDRTIQQINFQSNLYRTDILDQFMLCKARTIHSICPFDQGMKIRIELQINDEFQIESLNNHESEYQTIPFLDLHHIQNLFPRPLNV
jgi:hypothetical protein